MHHRSGRELTRPRIAWTDIFRAVAAAGLPEDPDLVIYANYLEDGGYQATKRLLDLPQRPDGLFVTNNRMAVGVLRALQEAGREHP